MGKSHITSQFVSELTPLSRGQEHQVADLIAELQFLRDLVGLPHATLQPRHFKFSVGWCVAPSQQRGYEGPFILLQSYAGRHYALTRENEEGHLCLQGGSEAEFESMCREGNGRFTICFGALPHVFSGPAEEVMMCLARDILDKGVLTPSKTGALRDAWTSAIARYKTEKAHQKIEGYPVGRGPGMDWAPV